MSVAVLAVTTVSFSKDPLKVGYIYADEIGDYGWTYQHELAKQKVDKKLGDKISSDYVITSKENAQSTLDDMAKKNMI